MNQENCGSQKTREGQVSQEFNKAEKVATELVTQINLLIEQLSSVLRDEDTLASVSNEEEAETDLVPLARRIRSHSILLQIQEHRLQEILNKLEIR